jgi:hypothetical protein
VRRGPLDLPDSPRKLVFRRIVQQLRNDPTLSRACRVILAWEGDPQDARPLALPMAPGLRLTPTFGPDVWASPDSMRGWMYLAVEMIVPGYDVGDMIDLWWAIEIALYPRDLAARNAFQKELREVGLARGIAGAYTGLVEFSQPVADPAPSENYQHSIGQMRIEILLNLNT